MRSILLSSVVAFLFIAAAGRSASAQVDYGPWQQTARGNYYRVCMFPAGGHQLLILFPSKPQWVYWYNPDKQVYWCCCPTIKHPSFGSDAANGVDQFLMATTKSNKIEDTEFPDDAGPNFKSNAKAKDKNGQDVTLGCPPPDLPPGV